MDNSLASITVPECAELGAGTAAISLSLVRYDTLFILVLWFLFLTRS